MSIPAWEETWTHFGFDLNKIKFNSASMIVEAGTGKQDPDSASYIYGWYMYLNKEDFRPEIVKEILDLNSVKAMGYQDAKGYYESNGN